MISHTELRKGVKIIIDKEPYEILESMALKKAQRRVVIQTKIKNLISGSVLDRNFHQGDVFKEADLSKTNIKFLYSHRGRFFFCQEDNPLKRIELSEEKIKDTVCFLKPNQILEGLIFKNEIIDISLPIKINLSVKESPPGVKGDRSQAGNKSVILETGAEINVPLFIKEGDIIEINTEKKEYTRRIEKKN